MWQLNLPFFGLFYSSKTSLLSNVHRRLLIRGQLENVILFLESFVKEDLNAMEVEIENDNSDEDYLFLLFILELLQEFPMPSSENLMNEGDSRIKWNEKLIKIIQKRSMSKSNANSKWDSVLLLLSGNVDIILELSDMWQEAFFSLLFYSPKTKNAGISSETMMYLTYLRSFT